jgi:hypothetical protein
VLGTGRDIMHNLNNDRKNNTTIITAAILLSLATIVLVASTAIIAPLASHSAWASTQGLIVERDRPVTKFSADETQFAKAPAVVSGDNIYIAWWTNNTENGNEEVMFRASTDGGATFSNRTNLSNSSDADSWRVEIAGEGDTVVVSWWETNQTSDLPVARISTDGGETFGPMLMLGMNGTVSGVEEEAATEEGEGEGEEASAEGVIEEAVGGP